LQRAAGRFENYWRSQGQANRRAILLSSSSADDLSIMLQQRHVNLLDDAGGVHLAEPIVAQTVMFYASLIAGDHAIATDASPGEGRWASDLARGDAAALLTPDWRISQLKILAPRLSGNVAMFPLPRFDPADAPTASWGGTMIGLPRAGHHLAPAWALAVALTENPPAGTLPALPSRWSDPAFHQPDPFFAGNQSIGDLYVHLAADMPARIVTPFSAVADVELSEVLHQAVQWQRANPHAPADDPEAFSNCMGWLQSAADDLRERIRLGTF
jgi:hypothetical protein